jgi:hypothetical protein
MDRWCSYFKWKYRRFALAFEISTIVECRTGRRLALMLLLMMMLPRFAGQPEKALSAKKKYYAAKIKTGILGANVRM